MSGAYFQFYTNIAYRWAERIIAIRAGASYSGYEDYVQRKVLQPAGIAYAALARRTTATGCSRAIAPRSRSTSTTISREVTSTTHGATFTIARLTRHAWCRGLQFRPATMVAPVDGCFRQEYLRMLQSTKPRLRPRTCSTSRPVMAPGPTACSLGRR